MTDIDRALDEVRRANGDLEAAIQQKQAKQAQRDRAVRRAHDAGASLQVIADVLDVHRTYVHQIVRAD